jgi:hypothetical protein
VWLYHGKNVILFVCVVYGSVFFFFISLLRIWPCSFWNYIMSIVCIIPDNTAKALLFSIGVKRRAGAVFCLVIKPTLLDVRFHLLQTTVNLAVSQRRYA